MRLYNRFLWLNGEFQDHVWTHPGALGRTAVYRAASVKSNFKEIPLIQPGDMYKYVITGELDAFFAMGFILKYDRDAVAEIDEFGTPETSIKARISWMVNNLPTVKPYHVAPKIPSNRSAFKLNDFSFAEMDFRKVLPNYSIPLRELRERFNQYSQVTITDDEFINLVRQHCIVEKTDCIVVTRK